MHSGNYFLKKELPYSNKGTTEEISSHDTQTASSARVFYKYSRICKGLLALAKPPQICLKSRPSTNFTVIVVNIHFKRLLKILPSGGRINERVGCLCGRVRLSSVFGPFHKAGYY